jgi:RNA polymerase sigma-70 factor (ECF subfamily)
MSMAAISEAIVHPLTKEFENIFREHSGLVFETACSITGKGEDAEDVVQTIFLRLLRRGIPSEFQKNPRAYLYRAAINQALNIIRTRRRHPTTDLEQIGIPAVHPDADSEEVIHRKLYEAIAELPPQSAEIVILRYMHDYTDVDIAKLLGKSRVTIAVRLHRARGQLKQILRISLGEEL